MANGRVKSILDSGYSTTLADFLDKLPQYYLQQQQLKDARDERDKNRQFQQTQYKNQLEQQRKNNEFRQNQFEFTKAKSNLDSTINLIKEIPFGQRHAAYKNLIESNPEYSGLNIDAIGDAYKESDKAYGTYQKLRDDYQSYSEMNLRDKFSNYDSIVGLRDKLKTLSNSITDKALKKEVENNLRTVTNDVKFAEQKAGKPFRDDDIPDNLKYKLDSQKSNLKNAYNATQALERRVLQYADITQNQDGSLNFSMKPYSGTTDVSKIVFEGIELPAESSNKEEQWIGNYNKNVSAFKAALQQYSRENARYNSFYKQNNLIYPELNVSKVGTLEEPKEPQTRVDASTNIDNEVSVNETFSSDEIQQGLNNPDTGLKILGALVEPEDDNIIRVKDGIIQDKEFFEAIKEFNNLPDDREQVVTIQSNNEENGIPTEVKDNVEQLADNKQQEQKVVEDKDVPIMLSPVSAGTRSEMVDRDPDAYKADIDISTMFPQELVSQNTYELSDIAKSGTKTGSARRYASKALGENLKNYIDLSNRILPQSSGDSFDERKRSRAQRQIEGRMKDLESRIKSEIGSYINPETGDFKDAVFTDRIYSRLRERFFPNLTIVEIKNMLRKFSTAKPKK
jgi:hypothetical protein